MSTQGIIKSYYLLINKVAKSGYPNKKVLIDFLIDDGFKVSVRTFDRYLDAIRNEFDVTIVYDFTHKGYYIEEKDKGDIKKFLNFLEIVVSGNVLADTLKDWKTSMKYISFESEGNLKGIESLNLLLDAAKNNRRIMFNHKSFDADESKFHIIEPYLLKEYQNRWYVIGEDIGDGEKDLGPNEFRTFGIDRITDLKLHDSNSTFKRFAKLDPINKFKHVIGLYYSDSEPEEVILSFTPHQGNYVRTLPLHKSQKVIIDNEDEFRISLFVVPNYELKQKILMLGDAVEVIKPLWFREEVIEDIKKALKRYK